MGEDSDYTFTAAYQQRVIKMLWLYAHTIRGYGGSFKHIL